MIRCQAAFRPGGLDGRSSLSCRQGLSRCIRSAAVPGRSSARKPGSGWHRPLACTVRRPAGRNGGDPRSPRKPGLRDVARSRSGRRVADRGGAGDKASVSRWFVTHASQSADCRTSVAPAGWKPAIQQIGNLRYDFVTGPADRGGRVARATQFSDGLWGGQVKVRSTTRAPPGVPVIAGTTPSKGRGAIVASGTHWLRDHRRRSLSLDPTGTGGPRPSKHPPDAPASSRDAPLRRRIGAAAAT